MSRASIRGWQPSQLRPGRDRGRYPSQCEAGGRRGPDSQPGHRRGRRSRVSRRRCARFRCVCRGRVRRAQGPGVRIGGAAVGADGAAADRLSGRNPDAVYVGSSVSTKLKVMGVDLAVMGDKEPVGEDDEVVSYSEPSRGIYKKLIVRNDRLAGAIVLGDGAVVPSLLQTFASGSPPARQPRGDSLSPAAAIAARGRRARRRPGRRAYLRLQRRVEGADYRGGPGRRSKRPGSVRRHTRVNRVRLVPARSGSDSRAGVPGPRDGDRTGGLRPCRHDIGCGQDAGRRLPLRISRSTRSSASSTTRTASTSKPTSSDLCATDGSDRANPIASG